MARSSAIASLVTGDTPSSVVSKSLKTTSPEIQHWLVWRNRGPISWERRSVDVAGTAAWSIFTPKREIAVVWRAGSSRRQEALLLAETLKG